MEFELLDEDSPANAYEAVRRYLQNPRRQIQSWGDRVPLLASATVVGLVVVEAVLATRLMGGLGRGLSAVGQVFGLTLLILIAELVLVNSAAGVASIAGKSGNRLTAMAYMSLALAPFLLVLPVALLCEVAPLAPGVRHLITALLGVKILASWKEIIETIFKLNRFQSLAAFYLAIGASALIGFVLIYAIAVGKIASALS